MSPLEAGGIVFAVTIVVLLSGAPVAFALGALSVGFMVLFQGFDSLGIVEVYGQTNCKAFSLKDNKEVECTAKSLPAMPPTGTAEGSQ